MARKRTFLPTKWALPRLTQPPQVVKSAARIMELLEFIDDVSRPVNLAEVSEELDLPQSSTSALLHTLTELGYLYLDRTMKTYITTCRTAMLGLNASADVLRNGALISLLNELHSETTEYVVLCTRLSCYAQYIYNKQPQNHDYGLLYNGLIQPLPVCGAGMALLSELPDDQIWGVLAPLYADEGYRKSLLPMPELLIRLHEVRNNGYAYLKNTHHEGGTTLAMLLPVQDHGHPLAIGVAGLAAALDGEKDALVIKMREALARYMSSATKEPN